MVRRGVTRSKNMKMGEKRMMGRKEGLTHRNNGKQKTCTRVKCVTEARNSERGKWERSRYKREKGGRKRRKELEG